MYYINKIISFFKTILNKNNTKNKKIKRSVDYRDLLPELETLQKYEQLCPGATKNILEMSEKQASYYQEIERIEVISDDKFYRLLLLCLLPLICVIASIILFNKDYIVTGTISMISGITFLIIILILENTNNAFNSNDEKND